MWLLQLLYLSILATVCLSQEDEPPDFALPAGPILGGVPHRLGPPVLPTFSPSPLPFRGQTPLSGPPLFNRQPAVFGPQGGLPRPVFRPQVRFPQPSPLGLQPTTIIRPQPQSGVIRPQGAGLLQPQTPTALPQPQRGLPLPQPALLQPQTAIAQDRPAALIQPQLLQPPRPLGGVGGRPGNTITINGQAVPVDPYFMDEFYMVPVTYQYGYDVNDDDSGSIFQHSQNRDGHDTSGSYRVALPDGRVQVVTYTADMFGYNAEVEYEGEARPYVPPTTPVQLGGRSVVDGTGRPAIIVDDDVTSSPFPQNLVSSRPAVINPDIPRPQLFSPTARPAVFSGPTQRPAVLAGPAQRPAAFSGPTQRPAVLGGPAQIPAAFLSPTQRPVVLGGPAAFSGPTQRPAFVSPSSRPGLLITPTTGANPVASSAGQSVIPTAGTPLIPVSTPLVSTSVPALVDDPPAVTAAPVRIGPGNPLNLFRKPSGRIPEVDDNAEDAGKGREIRIDSGRRVVSKRPVRFRIPRRRVKKIKRVRVQKEEES